MRWLSLLLLVGCADHAVGPTWNRTFCLARIAVENQVPGAWRITSVSDSLRGGCAAWHFTSQDETFVRGQGALFVPARIELLVRVVDSTKTPPIDTLVWTAYYGLAPGSDAFTFTRDSLDRLRFAGVQPTTAENWWPFVGWWYDPTMYGDNASYWWGDSVTTKLHWYFNAADQNDHFFLDALWLP